MDEPTFTGISTVAIPVTDQDRARALWEQLGFETTVDAELQPGFRWMELSLPGATTTLALMASGDEQPAGIDTGIRLDTPDARAAHVRLAGLGFTVGELLDWETAPLMFDVSDPDGNVLYVAQTD